MGGRGDQISIALLGGLKLAPEQVGLATQVDQRRHPGDTNCNTHIAHAKRSAMRIAEDDSGPCTRCVVQACV